MNPEKELLERYLRRNDRERARSLLRRPDLLFSMFRELPENRGTAEPEGVDRSCPEGRRASKSRFLRREKHGRGCSS